jgi:hypothetical protein
MKYYLGTQFVPNKGEAQMFYEVSDEEVVLRTMTYITGTDELTKIPDPVMKKLYRPEMLSEVDEAAFTNLWNRD